MDTTQTARERSRNIIRSPEVRDRAGDAEKTGDHSHTKNMRSDQTQDVAFEVIQSGLNLHWQ